MTTVALTASPTQLDAGTTYDLVVVNSGSSAVHVQVDSGNVFDQRLSPGQSVVVYPHGLAVTAYARSGSGQVDVTTQTNPQTSPVGSSVASPGVLIPAATSLRKWRAALAKAGAGTAAARVLFAGDSVTRGASATTPLYRNSFVSRFSRLLAAEYGHAGTGMVNLIDTDYTTDDRIVTTGTWTQSVWGAFGHGCLYAGPGTATITFTPDSPCDSFTIYYVTQNSGAGFNVSVDGGTNTPLSGFSASEAAASYTISGLTAGQHYLTITAPTSSGNVIVYAVEASLGTAGVRTTRFGRGGASASDLAAVGGGVTVVDSSYAAFTAAPPDLTVLCFGSNEVQLGTSIATFTANMQTLITKAKVSGDVLLLIPPIDVASPTIPTSQYRQALYALAYSNDCALLDLYTRWGAGAAAYSTFGLLSSDLTHPTDRGSADIAAALRSVLLGSGSRSAQPSPVRLYNFPQANITVTSTTFATFSAPSDLRIPAAAGDLLEIFLNLTIGSDASDMVMDVETLSGVGGSVVTCVSSGTATPLTNGIDSFYGPSGIVSTIGGSVGYVVKAADVDADGMVNLRLIYRLASGTTKSIFCNGRLGQWRARRTALTA